MTPPEPTEGLTAITKRARRMLAALVCVGLAVLAAVAADWNTRW